MWEGNVFSLEHYIKDQASDKTKIKALGWAGYITLPTQAIHALWYHVGRGETGGRSGERSRAAPAPGPNNVPYKVYKNCRGLLKLFWKLLGAAWITQSIPTSRSSAVISFTRKEKDSHAFNQFRGIDLLNMEGKISFSVLARRMINYLLAATPLKPEGRCAQVPWLCGAVCSSLGANPNSQVQ